MKRHILFMIAVAACGGDTGSGDEGTADGLRAEDFPAEVAGALCDAFVQCAEPLLDAFVGGDCVTELTRDFEDDLGDLRTLIASERVAYDGERAAACIEALRAAGCDALGGQAPDVCDEALDGTVARGGACNSDGECKGDSYCQAEAQCPGTCTALAKQGESCKEPEACTAGTFCNGQGKCQADIAVGKECGGTASDCVVGALCAGDDASQRVPGTCTSVDDVYAGAAGEVCDLKADQLCKVGLSCAVISVDMTGAVTECTKPVASGAPCKVAVPQQCPDDEYCDVGSEAGSFSGTCRRAPGADKPCGTNQLCGPGLACVGNGDATVCKPLARVGASCTADAACHSGLCRAGKCTAGLGCSP